MEKRRCAGCGTAFWPRPQVPEQKYCGKPECRRSRRRSWQQAKRGMDADYRDNQARAHRAWAGENSAYWQAYRSAHPDYVQANREKQRQRDGRRRAENLAKMDSSKPLSAVPSGTYLLVPQGEENLAKMDSLMVEITLLSER
jgi:hypothetical protein